MTFGVLFEETAPVLDALSGTLKAARKCGVVAYPGEVLMQGFSNAVVITLVKETHDGGSGIACRPGEPCVQAPHRCVARR